MSGSTYTPQLQALAIALGLTNATNLTGIITGCGGDATNCSGDVSAITSADLTNLEGDATGVSGDATYVSGDIDDCTLSESDRLLELTLQDLIETPP